MKKVRLDGVPGITMQGAKGEEGKRGYTTFYNEHLEFSPAEIDDGKILNKVLGFFDSDDDGILDKVVCIPTSGLTPIEHDRFLNNETNIVLYEVLGVVTVDTNHINTTESIIDAIQGKYSEEYIESLEVENTSSIINNEQSNFEDVPSSDTTENNGEEISPIDEYKNNLKYVNGKYILDDNSVEYVELVIENLLIPQLKYLANSITSFVFLDVLDTWMYNTTAIDTTSIIEVSASSKLIEFPAWRGIYQKKTTTCKGHKYSLRSVHGDSMLFDFDLSRPMEETGFGKEWLINAFYTNGSIDDNKIKIRAGSTLSGIIYDSSSGLPVKNAVIEIYSINESGINNIVHSDPNIFSPDVHPSANNIGESIYCVGSGYGTNEGRYEITLDNIPENVQHGMILKAYREIPEITEENKNTVDTTEYLVSYYILSTYNGVLKETVSNGESTVIPRLNVYLVKNEYDASDDTNSFSNLTVTDEYDYYDSTSPYEYAWIENEDGTMHEEKLTTQFICSQYQIYNALPDEDRGRLKVVAEFTKKDKLLNMSSVRTSLWDGCASDDQHNSPFGLLKNYNYALNFDNEEAGDFCIILKDFDEGNDKQIYNAKTIFPSFVIDEDYNIEIYAYYKTKTSAQEKLFLGKGSFNSTIEE